MLQAVNIRASKNSGGIHLAGNTRIAKASWGDTEPALLLATNSFVLLDDTLSWMNVSLSHTQQPSGKISDDGRKK